jgi:hypothetical protein
MTLVLLKLPEDAEENLEDIRSQENLKKQKGLKKQENLENINYIIKINK